MNIARHFIALTFATASLFATDAAKEIPLWPGGAPGSEGKTAPEKEDANHNVSSVHNPSITLFLPAAGKGNGIVGIARGIEDERSAAAAGELIEGEELARTEPQPAGDEHMATRKNCVLRGGGGIAVA